MEICERKSAITISSISGKIHVEIETDRLILSSYSNEDFEDCVRLYGDERLAKFFDHGKPRSREEVSNLVVQKTLHFLEGSLPLGLFSIFDKIENKFLGQADIMPTEDPCIVELGCIFLRDYHNQGYPIEVCKCFMIDYIEHLNESDPFFTQNPIVKVIATTHPKNYASQRIIKNLGMTFDKAQERFGRPRFWYSYTLKQEMRAGVFYDK